MVSTGSYLRSIAGSLPRHAGLRSEQRSQAAPTVRSFVTFLAVYLISGLTVLMLAVLVIETLLYPIPYPNPFTPYTALVPGGSSALVLGQYPCSSETRALESRDWICAINLISEDFDRVTVISWDERIREVQFLPTDLQVIDLLRRWGRPDLIRQSSEGYLLIWGAGVVARVPTGQRFSYLLSVRTVLLRPGS
jgi:hypothetical protein